MKNHVYVAERAEQRHLLDNLAKSPKLSLTSERNSHVGQTDFRLFILIMLSKVLKRKTNTNKLNARKKKEKSEKKEKRYKMVSDLYCS